MTNTMTYTAARVAPLTTNTKGTDTMGIDRHEQQRQGKGRASGAARRRRAKDSAAAGERAAVALTAAQQADRHRAKFLRGDADAASDNGPPQLVEDAPLPAAPDGTRLPVPERETRAQRLDRTQTVDVRIPRAWLDEMSALTGEPVQPATNCIRATLVLLRALTPKR